jgi:hypothetical protein
MKIYREDQTMMANRYNVFSRGSSLVLLVTAVLLLLTGCAGGNYGKLARDRDLDNMFLNYEVLPDHNYYITGGYNRPDAILAINKEYELDNSANIWVPVPNVDTGQMHLWIESIDPNENYRYSGVYYAAYILAPDGKRVGAWFAIENQTTVKFLGGNRIQVYPPNSQQDFNFRRGMMFHEGR